MANSNRDNPVMRILITLLGVALIVWGVGTVVLGVIGERDTAVITSIRRQGGERNEVIPGRYTYSIGYTFTLPNGKRVDDSTTKIGSAIYLKADGRSTTPVRYLKSAPFINTMEENTKPSFGQVALVTAGTFLIVVMNKRKENHSQDGPDFHTD